ncbi:MAG: serine/threonine protein kinase with sensor(s) [Nitrospirae bacterium]|nr:serine/threonine protein kinase with sensor(s) [Nitrospirota bacterium]
MLKKLLYIIGLIAAALTIYMTVGFYGPVKVPMLTGKSINEAESLLRDKRLSLIVEGEDYDPAIPEGQIIRQDAKPGEKIKRGSAIRVFVSGGAGTVSMPSFEGQLLDEVKLTLINLGMKTGKVTLVRSETVGAGRVIAQRPLPGNAVGNEVNFLVSKGMYNVSYKCPSFVNMPLDDARGLADLLGLKLIEQEEGNKVTTQKPAAGTVINRGDSVEVTLGRSWGLWF